MSEQLPGRLRIDKWLFFSRLLKSRSLAAELANSGKIRVNKQKIDKASYLVKADDVLTISYNQRIKTIKITALGERRGPAVEAQKLYQDLTPVETMEEKLARQALEAQTQTGPRPTKRDRRQLDNLQNKFEH
ncbi:RNA-binding S4 domain-containing protein [Bartonella sp. HY329]|uniref:RNA-binding S4 domain-containing protein n=1 Tax=unclassified Bartonella TaxID=2645622 RepID=UPI0021C721CE|nr:MULTISPECIES: RNA-binding S4 domain-containing protein [unclassified Bartonella]UXM94951.1 RNA-binding S4 domain-containing protein [Bartonella sp. HY329]UXN09274.1 RNA-binding S4 domain-containing protein [Bartonella sp. HY328]